MAGAGRGFRKAVDAAFSVNVTPNGSRAIERRFDNRDEGYGESNYRGRRNYNNNRRGARGGRWKRGGFGRGRGGRRDEDGDLEMGESRSGYGGNSNRGGHSRERDDNDEDWHKVVIPEGRKHSRDWLLNKIKQFTKIEYEEFGGHCFKDSFIFHVKGRQVADAIRKVSNVIITKDGSKLYLTVRPSGPPAVVDGSSNRDTVVEESQDKIDAYKTFLGRRYDVQLVKLDLTNVSADKELRENRIEPRVWDHRFMNTTLKLIFQICPQLKCLDLSSNRLKKLNTLHSLNEMCPQLEELNLSKNDIRFSGELSKIGKHPNIKSIWLEGNPLADAFKDDRAQYIDEVRNKLPNIEILDGTPLPKSIKCDLEIKHVMPEVKPSYSPNEEAKRIVSMFVQNFFKIYDSTDSDNRQKLLDAYHSDATFSLSVNSAVQNANGTNPFGRYQKLSRNLKKIADRNVRHSLIKNKKLALVAQLCELPSTTHKFESFVLDVPLVLQDYLLFTLSGLFVDEQGKVRGFSRTFGVIPDPATQFLIMNDQLTIRNATDGQLKEKKTVPDVKYTPEQLAMVKRFSEQSRMNTSWSLECLTSNGWVYDNAAEKFTQLKNANQIPPEAWLPG